MAEDRRWLMAKVARMYYHEGLTQEVIAGQLSFSRSAISRLLKEAQEEGVVEINIRYPWQQVTRLEHALADQFGLNAVRVLERGEASYTEMLGGLGMLAARYMEQELESNMIVAVASGTAVYETVRALNKNQHLDATVVQVMGVTGTSNPYVDGAELARLMASRLGGRYLYLQSPLVVKNAHVRGNLLREPAIQQVLALGQQASIALVGIGTVYPEDSSLLRTGFVTPQMLEELMKASAVGETCGRPFNAHGEPVVSGVGSQIISISLDELKKIPTVIAVAGGDHKVASIHGLLQGKIVNVLVTDDQTALKLLEM